MIYVISYHETVDGQSNDDNDDDEVMMMMMMMMKTVLESKSFHPHE
jgi:hypothetical protein